MSDHFWSSSSSAASGGDDDKDNKPGSKINHSASEWAFQQFLKEEVDKKGVDHNEEEEDKEVKNKKNGCFENNNNNNVPADLEDYQAFLKKKLNLACAAVSISMASIVNPQDSSGTTNGGSQASDTAQLGSKTVLKALARPSHFADTGFPANVDAQSGIPAQYSRIAELADLPTYSLLNGKPETITPYLIRASIPTYARWVPVAGMRHEKALQCSDAFVKSHIWQVMRNKPTDWNEGHCRKAGFILGVARAIIFNNYKISDDRLIAGETARPVIFVEYSNDEAANPTYRLLADDPRTEEERTPVDGGEALVADPRAALTEAFVMTDEERAVLPTLIKSAQAVIPLQGYGLITEGHHYLAERSKASFKAFWAVERQHWVGERVKTYMEDNVVNVRDLLWHKAGHPVAIAVKQFAATSELVRENLRNAGLGSAAMWLPAVEPEVRAIGAFLRVTDAVRASIETCGGVVDNSLLKEVQAAIARFPLAEFTDMPGYKDPEPIMLGQKLGPDGNLIGGVRVTNRMEALDFAKSLIPRIQNKVAICFGFYVSMLEAGGAQAKRDSLVRSFSLKKLQSECIAWYNEGVEYYKDFQAMRSRAKKEGKV